MVRIATLLSHIATLIALAVSTGAAQDSAAPALGAKIFAENCNRCHEAPNPATRDRRQWNAIALHMRLFSDLSREDEQRVAAFLRTYNTASMKHEKGAPAAR